MNDSVENPLPDEKPATNIRMNRVPSIKANTMSKVKETTDIEMQNRLASVNYDGDMSPDERGKNREEEQAAHFGSAEPFVMQDVGERVKQNIPGAANDILDEN